MSDTPRTDAKELESASCNTGIHAHYGWKMARTLERKLAEQDAEIASLRAEVALLRELHSRACEAVAEHRERAEQPRTDAEWKAADRRKRINDLAARYAGQLAAGLPPPLQGENEMWLAKVVVRARALAAAVVEAEE